METIGRFKQKEFFCQISFLKLSKCMFSCRINSFIKVLNACRSNSDLLGKAILQSNKHSLVQSCKKIKRQCTDVWDSKGY